MVTNPPFAAAEEFVHKDPRTAYVPKFALLTRHAFLEGQGRHARLCGHRQSELQAVNHIADIEMPPLQPG